MYNKDHRVHILHVVNSMKQGGVEAVIANVIRHSNPNETDHHILVLGKDCGFEGEYAGLPVKIHYLSKMSIKEQSTLAKEIDVVHVAQRKAAFLVTPFAKFMHKPVILGVHSSIPPSEQTGLRERIYNQFSAGINKQAAGIVCCAESVHDTIKDRPRAKGKTQVITNGIDPKHFIRDEAAGKALREELGIPEDTPVIGISARYVPMKDIPNFIQAAKLVKERHADTPPHFIMSGNGMDQKNAELVKKLKEAGIYEQTHLLGVRFDMDKVYSSMDILALSSSKHEAMSMALLEGTASGCLCISTDVGDHRKVMEKTGGKCVPTRNAAALAEGIEEYIAMTEEQRADHRGHGRAMINAHYHVKDMASQYNNLFKEVALSRAKNNNYGMNY